MACSYAVFLKIVVKQLEATEIVAMLMVAATIVEVTAITVSEVAIGTLTLLNCLVLD